MLRKNMAALGGCIALASAFALGAGGMNVRAEESSPVESGEPVKIDRTNFPDRDFRNYVTANIDANDNGILDEEEIISTINIDINTETVKSLKGLEFFTSLKILEANPGLCGPDVHSALTELDVSKNTELESLYISSNSLKSLDLSQNTKLASLTCSFNMIESLDLSSNTVLSELECDWNEITSIDLSNNTELVWMTCAGNRITSLDLTKNTNISILDFGFNPITDLKLGEMKELYHLNCSGCGLKGTLDVSMYPELDELCCVQNELTEIITGNESKLMILECGENKLSKLDVSKMPELVILRVDHNQLSSLDVSANTKLMSLDIQFNQFASIDLSKNTSLKWLRCYANPLPEVNITNQAGIVDMVKTTEPMLSEDGTYLVYYKDDEEEEYEHSHTIDVLGYVLEIAFDTEINYTDEQSGIGDFVERLYTEALGRASEEAGKKYWIDEITNGRKTGGDCGLFFLLGEEFTNRNLSEEDLVETLYKTFFGRASEADGKAYWVGQLKKGVSRETVIRGFIDSKEWCNLCADYGVRSGAPTAKAEKASKNAISFATRLYICCLGRDPEEQGLAYWSLALTNLEQTGASAAKEFFGSQEFANLNLSNEAFVTRLYTTFMDREPELEGFNFWVGQLKGGMARSEVLAKFIVSQEFTEICAKYGIERGNV